MCADSHSHQARELRYLEHPRIVGYEDDFLHSTAQSYGRDAHLFVCIVMEKCEVSDSVCVRVAANVHPRTPADA